MRTCEDLPILIFRANFSIVINGTQSIGPRSSGPEEFMSNYHILSLSMR